MLIVSRQKEIVLFDTFFDMVILVLWNIVHYIPLSQRVALDLLSSLLNRHPETQIAVSQRTIHILDRRERSARSECWRICINGATCSTEKEGSTEIPCGFEIYWITTELN